MINDDILIKYSRTRLSENFQPGPKEDNWIDYTRTLRRQIQECKLGFPGIGDGDLDICRPWDCKPGWRVILSDNLDANCGSTETDHAPILGLILEIDPSNGIALIEVEGIGEGLDFTRDPGRNIRPGTKLHVGLSGYQTILHMTATPRCDGGSVYYYYNKHPRDSRW
jgi:hypothetical protein